MTIEQLVTKQQLEIENLKELTEGRAKTLSELRLMFIGCGAPLNDNALNFNREQMVWCQNVLNLIEEL